jgi:hypothetical protein
MSVCRTIYEAPKVITRKLPVLRIFFGLHREQQCGHGVTVTWGWPSELSLQTQA